MASVINRPDGHRWLKFFNVNGNRETIKLGKVNSKTAMEVCRRVELLLEARISNTACDRQTAEWLAGIGEKLRDRLAYLGLIDKPAEKINATTLDAFVTAYVASLNVKPGTRFNLDLARRNLVEFFGAAKPLAAITHGDADDYRRWLRKSYGENTVRRRCGRAKQFFRAAVRKKLIAESPFGDMKDTKVNGNEDRFYFVSRDEADKVLAACPNAQWRLLFALSRYAGLRCPSEHTALTWADIDFETGRMTVQSPKTEHVEGHESREVPIFPELRPYLEAVKAEAKKNAVHVFTIRSIERSRTTGRPANLGTRLHKIIKRAGLTPWPKTFHNLRATRQTELAQQGFAEHVVCAWLGNSQAVAREHYLRVTADDFSKATGQIVASAKNEEPKSEPLNRNQKRNQHSAASSGTLGNAVLKCLEAKGYGDVFPVIKELLENVAVTPRGLEPLLPP